MERSELLMALRHDPRMGEIRPSSTVHHPAIPALRNTGLMARVLDAAPLGMLLVGLDGTIVYSNRAFADMVGYVPAAEHAFLLLDMVDPDERLALRLQFERLVRGEVRSWRGEYRFRHQRRSELPVMISANRLDSGDGEHPIVILQLTDIELQKKAEEALVHSDARWNSALESARQGVWEHDIRTDTMFYSRMWRLMRGMAPDAEVDGNQESWLARIHPDDRAFIRANITRQDEGDDLFDAFEYRERIQDGSYIWILSRGRPIEWDENGAALRTIGTDTDITRLKTAEQELAAEKERLHITLQSIADGVISADAAGRVEFMNPAAEHLTGMCAAEARGRPVSEVFRLRNDVTGAPMACPVSACLEQGQPVRVEDDAVLSCRECEARDIRCTAAPVPGADGEIAGAVLVFQDVTQSRTLQRQLAHTAAHDALTGLVNRAGFEKALEAAIAAVRVSGRASSLIYIDLDHFKPVNDTAGHAAGDALLRQVAQTIRESCRAHDVVGRIGGDEFAVLLEFCPAESGLEVAGKIVRAIGALIFTWAGRQYRIGASAGLAMVTMDSTSPLGHMGEADAACYAAKAAGRGRAVAFSDMVNPINRNRR